MKRKRVVEFDMLKGIGIISVIAGHVAQNYNSLRLMQIFYSFHMPLFFIIAGYFINARKSVREFCVSRIKTLFKYYIIACLGIIIGHCGIGVLKHYDIFCVIKELLKWIYISIYGIGNGKGSVYINRNFQICHTDEIGMLWFLLALLWAQCIVRVFVKYSEKKCLIIVGIVTVLGIYSSHLIWLPLSVQNGMAATVWVYIGFLIKDKEMLVKWKRYRSKDTLLFLCVIFWGISIVFGCTELYKNYYKLGIIDIVGAFSGCVVLYYCVEKIKNRNSFLRLQEFLTSIGKNSIYVYIIHYWEQKISPNNTVGLLVRRYLGINIYIDFAFSVVIILCICVLVIKIYEQVLIDYLKKKRS